MFWNNDYESSLGYFKYVFPEPDIKQNYNHISICYRELKLEILMVDVVDFGVIKNHMVIGTIEINENH